MRIFVFSLFLCSPIFSKPFSTSQGMQAHEIQSGFKGAVGLWISENGEHFVVTELRGAIKAFRKGAPVYKIGQSPNPFVPKKELPDLAGEIGQVGVCGHQNNLYTTDVTTIGKTRINRIIHWQLNEENKKLKIKPLKKFTRIFENSPTNNPHQIGFCFIGHDKKLWVGTGDGAHHRTSHLPEYSNGKILRLNLDLSAPKDNPFASSREDASPYVFAMGFRNPFSIALARDGRLFVADNGPNVDRLVVAQPGQNFPWDGHSNESLLYGNLMTWPKSIGPSGMILIENQQDHPLNNHLVVAASYEQSIYAIPIDSAGVSGVAKKLLWLNKGARGAIGDLAEAKNGDIFFSHMEIKESGGLGKSSIYRLSLSDENTSTSSQKQSYVDAWGCRGCHIFGGRGVARGPSLDGVVNRLKKSHKDVRGWIKRKIKNPAFDNPNTGMTKIEIPDEELELLLDEIMRGGDLSKRDSVSEEAPHEKMKWFLKQNPEYYSVIAIIFGLVSGFLWGRRYPFKR